MAQKDINSELLGRLAAGLEESGHALKLQSGQITQMQSMVARIDTKVDSSHARLKKVEEKIDGNGGTGIRTELALAQQRVEETCKNVCDLEKWRRGMGEKKLDAVREDRGFRWTIFFAVAAMLISMAGLVGNCAPHWIKSVKVEDGRGN